MLDLHRRLQRFVDEHEGSEVIVVGFADAEESPHMIVTAANEAMAVRD